MCLGKGEEAGWEMHKRKANASTGLELSVQGKLNLHKAFQNPLQHAPGLSCPPVCPAPSLPPRWLLTWLLWMDIAQASWRGSCRRLRSWPPVACTVQRSAWMTSVTPHRKRTRGSPEGGVG